MKLVFEKDESGTVSTKLKTGSVALEFSYVKMIENLLNGDILEDSEFIGDIDQADIQKIEALIAEIKEASAAQSNPAAADVPNTRVPP